MVYRGKPSLGCGTCRNRHVKCDQTRPICLACQKSGRQCLGYRDWAELWVRDQTREVTGNQSDSSSRLAEDFPTQQEQHQPHHLLRGSVTPSKDQLALAHFLSNFVGPFQTYPYQTSYFQMMPMVYLPAKPNTALEAATLSLAYSTYRVDPGGNNCIREACSYYQVALNRLREALLSTVEAKSNETLLTVLLMEAIEAITGNSDSEPDAGSHIAGAMALIRLRGREGFRDDISRKLLLCTRGLAVMRDLRRFINSEHSLSFFPVRSDLDIPFLTDDTAEGPAVQDTDNNLLSPMSRLSPLWEDANRLLGQPRTDNTSLDICSLISRCRQVDESLVQRMQNLRQPFESETAVKDVTDRTSSEHSTQSVYWGRVDSYTDLFVAASWNEYRVARLFAQHIFIRAYNWIAAHQNRRDILDATEASIVASRLSSQELIDGICASIPFLVGRCSEYNPGLLGKYLCFVPLFFAQSTEVIEEAQKEWILAQMLQIVRDIGIDETKAGILLRQKREQLQSLHLNRLGMSVPEREAWVGSSDFPSQ